MISVGSLTFTDEEIALMVALTAGLTPEGYKPEAQAVIYKSRAAVAAVQARGGRTLS